MIIYSINYLMRAEVDPYKEIPAWVFSEEKRKYEMLSEIGILDKNEMDVAMAMTDFAQKYQSSRLPIQALYKHIYDYGLRINNNSLKVESNIVTLLKSVYPKLYKKNLCSAENKDNKVVGFILTDPSSIRPEEMQAMMQRLKKEYTSCETDLNRLFPVSEMLPKNFQNPKYLIQVQAAELSPDRIKELSQKNAFIKVMLSSQDNVVLAADELDSLYSRAFDRVKKFLENSADLASLMIMKIKQQYPALSGMASAGDLIHAGGKEPQFWASLATEILNYAGSSERQRVLVQSTQLVKYLSILQGQESQKQTHDEKSMDILLQILKTYKVSFNKGQLLQLRDKHTYLKLYTERDYIDVVTGFLDKYTVPDKPGLPPVLVPLKIKGENRYVHRDHFFLTFFEKLDSVSYEIGRVILEKCHDKNARFYQDPALHNPESFDRYIEDLFLKQGDFLVDFITNPVLLFTLIHYSGTKENAILKQKDRFFYPLGPGEEFPRMRGYADILQIRYNEILREAGVSKSFNFNFFTWFASLFKSFGSSMNQAVESQLIERKKLEQSMKEAQKLAKKKAKKKNAVQKTAAPSGPSAQEQKKAIAKQSLTEAIAEMSGGEGAGKTLESLEKRWNHILNQADRKEFDKMINTKIVGRIKFMKNFTPEGCKNEIQDMLDTESVLSKVSDRESLKKYMLLYLMEALRQKL